MIRGIIYIATLVMQLSGALILLINYISVNIDNYINKELNNSHNIDGGELESNSLEITKDEYRILSNQIHCNRVAFLYILIGYALSPFAEEYWSDYYEIIMILVFTAAVCLFSFIIIRCIINSEFTNEHEHFKIIDK